MSGAVLTNPSLVWSITYTRRGARALGRPSTINLQKRGGAPTMRRATRAVCALTIAASVLVMAACGGNGGGSASSSSGPKRPTIGFVVPLISNPYWKLIQDFAQVAAGTLNVNLLTAQANSDETTEINIVEGWIARKVDGMVVGPVSDKVGAKVLSDAEAAKIPVTFMQRSP